ncbi:hypothetical protein B0H19DRAFT_1057274 [Mycena capillaripes]|nr:hypothetical protein B0H19DRAFT_1057274 [Mycena capillaripes]
MSLDFLSSAHRSVLPASSRYLPTDSWILHVASAQAASATATLGPQRPAHGHRSSCGSAWARVGQNRASAVRDSAHLQAGHAAVSLRSIIIHALRSFPSLFCLALFLSPILRIRTALSDDKRIIDGALTHAAHASARACLRHILGDGTYLKYSRRRWRRRRGAAAAPREGRGVAPTTTSPTVPPTWLPQSQDVGSGGLGAAPPRARAGGRSRRSGPPALRVEVASVGGVVASDAEEGEGGEGRGGGEGEGIRMLYSSVRIAFLETKEEEEGKRGNLPFLVMDSDSSDLLLDDRTAMTNLR